MLLFLFGKLMTERRVCKSRHWALPLWLSHYGFLIVSSPSMDFQTKMHSVSAPCQFYKFQEEKEKINISNEAKKKGYNILHIYGTFT